MRGLETEPGKGRKDDHGLQREVLAYALVEHPVPVSLAQLQEELRAGPAVTAAVEALVADELLRWQGDEVVPTEAAVRFNEIEPIEPPSPT